MLVIYFRGRRINRTLLEDLETSIMKSLEPYTKEVNKVKIRPDEYEFRCKSTNKNIRVLTVHLRLANRSFIIQWLINLLFKEKERLFIGIKFGNVHAMEDPSYRFDMVPYRKKSFIRQRWEVFREIDDIPTVDKSVDNMYMIKADSLAYVEHFVENEEFISLTASLEPFLEHLVLQKSTEDTEPNYANTYEFRGIKDTYDLDKMLRLFFLGAILHIANHESVKKKVAKGSKGKSMSSRRGIARRGAGRTSKPKTNRKKTKPKRKSKSKRN